MPPQTLSLNTIEAHILDCYDEIKHECRPQNGDCASVAQAIQNVYGGELVGLYETDPSTCLPTHVMTRINNTLIDNEGIATEYDVVETHIITRHGNTHQINMNNVSQHFISEEEHEIHDAMFNPRIVSRITQILSNK